MPEDAFDFESEFSILDIGATTSVLRTGGVRPSLLIFTEQEGVEAVALDWEGQPGDVRPAQTAFEEARKYTRDKRPLAYGFIAHLARGTEGVEFRLPGINYPAATESLGIAMFTQGGSMRGVTYQIRRSGGNITFGMPNVEEGEILDWCPFGDIWANPFCKGDLVRFRHRDKAVEPSTPLWQAIVDLTRLRMHDDPRGADEYMAFLDDLRNGIFLVEDRSPYASDQVLLRPRTSFNPLGTISIEASRLLLVDSVAPNIEKVETTAVR